MNDMVYDPETEARPFEEEQKPKRSLADLASTLA
jgi:hypothetical protein